MSCEGGVNVTSYRRACVLVLLCIELLVAGCAGPSLKATPLFGGEYKAAEGKPEDRVNLWPLVYYRRPALSVLWPIGELTPERGQLWPVLTVDGLGEEKQRVRILAPLVDLNFRTRDYHVLPALFWGRRSSGKPYFVLFPVAWWIPDCFKAIGPVFWEKGWLTVFPVLWRRAHEFFAVPPLYVRRERPGGAETDVLWPLLNVKTGKGEHGWHLWPLYGAYSDGDAGTSRRYALWPLLMSRWRDDLRANVRWSAPFYFGGRRAGTAWDAVLPFFFRYRSPARRIMAALPLFWADREGETSSLWVAPTFWRERGPDKATDALLPFFARWRQGEVSGLTVLPLFLAQRDGDKNSLWVAPTFWRERGPDGATDALWPFVSHWRQGQASRRWLFPLYYSSADGQGRSLTLSPIYLGGRADGAAWDAIPPLLFRSSSEDGRMRLVLPFYYDSESGAEKRQLLFPLFYRWSDGESRFLLTLPFGLKRSAGDTQIYAYPLLSAYRSSPQGKDLWALFPLSHSRWDDEGLDSSHVLPLYYWNRANDLFLSLPFCRKGGEDEGWASVLGPLAIWRRKGDDRYASILWPLTGAWWNKAGGPASSYVLPFYCWDGDRKQFLSLPFCRKGGEDEGWASVLGPLGIWRWKGDERQASVLWPLTGAGRSANESWNWAWPLWSYRREGSEKGLSLGPFVPGVPDSFPALSLAGARWGEKRLSHHLFPLWFYGREGQSRLLNLGLFLWQSKSKPGERSWMFSLIAGASKTDDSSAFWVLPFWRMMERRAAGWSEGGKAFTMDVEHSKWGVFPLLWRFSETPLDETVRERILPISGRRPAPVRPPATSHWVLLPLCAAKTRRETAPGREGLGEDEFSLLWRLYDSRREVGLSEEKPGERYEYTRRRVLWHLLHYERLDNSTALDIFPGITYDHTPGESRTFSILWRVLRYEWDKEEGRKFHFLFIPF